MKSKEEIIQKFRDDPFTGSLTQKQAEQCFEIASEYAKQEAIALLKVMREGRYHTDIVSQEIKWVARDVRDKLLGFYGEATDEQLYNLFLESKKQKV